MKCLFEQVQCAHSIVYTVKGQDVAQSECSLLAG